MVLDPEFVQIGVFYLSESNATGLGKKGLRRLLAQSFMISKTTTVNKVFSAKIDSSNRKGRLCTSMYC